MPFVGSPEDIDLLQKVFAEAELAYKKLYGQSYSDDDRNTVETLIQGKLGILKKIAAVRQEAESDPTNLTKAATAQRYSENLTKSIQTINDMVKPKSARKDWDTMAVYDPPSRRVSSKPLPEGPIKPSQNLSASSNAQSSGDSPTAVSPPASLTTSSTTSFKTKLIATKTPDLSTEQGCLDLFLAKHKELYDRSGIFKRTTVKSSDSLNKVIGYAIENSNSRSRQTLIELGWWDKKAGTLSETAPESVRAVAEQVATEKRGIYRGT